MSALQNTVCRKIGKPFSYKIEQSQKGYKESNATEAFKYFDNWNHVFHKYGKFILINIKNSSKGVLKQRLKGRESYRIKD